MSTDEPFRTDYEFLKGVEYIFVSPDRNLSREECYQRHDRENLPFSIHLDVALIGCSTRGAVIDFIAV